MTDSYSVQPPSLYASAGEWTDQSSRLATARTRLVDSSTAGFPAAVATRAETWASAWGTVVGDLADQAQTIAEQLDAAFTAYTSADMEAQERFQTWLGSAT